MYGRGLQLGATAWASGVGLLLLALLTSTAAYQGFDCGQGELKAAHGAFVWHLLLGYRTQLAWRCRHNRQVMDSSCCAIALCRHGVIEAVQPLPVWP